MRIISAEWNRYKPYNPELIWILKPNCELTDKLNCSWIQTRELILLPMRYYVVLHGTMLLEQRVQNTIGK